MTRARTGLATADGAELHYEVHGTGPTVLVVQGGPSDARATAGLVEALAPARTVVTYDRRGLARSSAHAGPGPVTLWTHAADAAAVVDAAVGERAGVFGTSIGALIGLHLLVAHPDRVAHLVAHEPPMPVLVRDPERERAFDEVAALARDEGPLAAARRMATVIAGAPGSQVAEPGVVPVPPADTMLADFATFFAQDFPAVRAATLGPDDIPSAGHAALTVAGGTLSSGWWEQRCAVALAAACGRELLELPGAHNGAITHPRGTAEVLLGVL